MDQLAFGVFVLLPSVAFLYVSLVTFYGWVKAYLAISWIPITLFLITYMFLEGELVPANQKPVATMLLEAVAWTSLMQGLIGVVLVARAAVRKEDWVIPAIATLWTTLPFFLFK